MVCTSSTGTSSTFDTWDLRASHAPQTQYSEYNKPRLGDNLLEMAHTALTAALAAALCLVRQADGHGLLTNPAPRTGTNRAGPNKGNVGPCGTGGGNTNAGASSMTVAAGETAALEWRIDANHGGPCQINLAATGAAINEPANNALTPLCQNGACPAGAQVGVENTNNNNNDPANGIFACAQNGGNDDRTVTVPADAAPGPAVLQWQWNGDAMYYGTGAALMLLLLLT